MSSIFRSRLLILGCVLAATLVGCIVAVSRPNEYVSEALFLIRLAGETTNVDPVTGRQELYQVQAIRQNVPSVIGSEELLYRVAERVGHEYILAPYVPPIMATDGSFTKTVDGWFLDLQRLAFREREVNAGLEDAVLELKDSLRIDDVRGRSDTIKVSYEANNPQRAKKILEVFMDEARQRHLHVYNSGFELDLIEKSCKAARIGLTEARRDLKAFLAGIEASDFDRAWNESREILRDLRSEMTTLVEGIRGDKLVLQELRKRLSNLNPTTLAEVTVPEKNERIGQLEERINDTESELLDARSRLQPGDQEIKRLESSLSTLIAQLKQERAKPQPFIVERREVDNHEYVTTRDRIGDIELSILVNEQKERHALARTELAQRRFDNLAGHRESYEMHEREIKRLERELESSENRRKVALRKQQLNAQDMSSLSILSAPSLPLTRSAPNRPRILLGAILVGLFVGILLVVLRAITDSTVRTPEDLERVTGRHTLAIVPLLNSKNLRRHRKLRATSST